MRQSLCIGVSISVSVPACAASPQILPAAPKKRSRLVAKAWHACSGFQYQYLGRIDHFSVGILALETLFALWDPKEAADGSTPGLLEARRAWARYWSVAIHMFQMFHLRGALEVRNFIIQSADEGITAVVEYLKQLRCSPPAGGPPNHPVGANVCFNRSRSGGPLRQHGRWLADPPRLGDPDRGQVSKLAVCILCSAPTGRGSPAAPTRPR